MLKLHVLVSRARRRVVADAARTFSADTLYASTARALNMDNGGRHLISQQLLLVFQNSGLVRCGVMPQWVKHSPLEPFASSFHFQSS
jgi:hypothetical protein